MLAVLTIAGAAAWENYPAETERARRHAEDEVRFLLERCTHSDRAPWLELLCSEKQDYLVRTYLSLATEERFRIEDCEADATRFLRDVVSNRAGEFCCYHLARVDHHDVCVASLAIDRHRIAKRLLELGWVVEETGGRQPDPSTAAGEETLRTDATRRPESIQ